MIRKSVQRFSEKIMRRQGLSKEKAALSRGFRKLDGWRGQRVTTTLVPTETRLNRSEISAFSMRMQP